MRIVTINGILTDGTGNVDTIGQALQAAGVPWVDASYPTVNPLTARWRANGIMRSIAPWMREDDVIVCHSFGCVIGGLLMDVVPVKAAYLIAPAASRRWNFDKVKGDPMITAYWSPEDTAVRVGSWLPFHPFGAAGTEGYTSARVRNVETDSDHCGYFSRPELRSMIVKTILTEITS